MRVPPPTDNNRPPPRANPHHDESASPRSECVLDYPKRKSDFTILLVGNDSNGKSALISFLLDLSEGKGPLELRNAIDSTRSHPRASTNHQNSQATTHVITFPNGHIRIINIPCFVDDNGKIQGNEVEAHITQAIEPAIPSLDTALIMVDGTLEQPIASTEYMLNIVATLLPRSMADNIGLLLTDCDADTQKLEPDALPAVFTRARMWPFQNPLPFCLSYRSQEGRGTQRQRATQKRKLEGIYDAAVDILDEILAWVDETPPRATEGIPGLYRKIHSIEQHLGLIILASNKYRELRQGIVDLRRRRNKLKRSKVGMSRSSQASVDTEVKSVKAKIEKDRERLMQVESEIAQSRASALGLAQFIGSASLGVDYTDHIFSALASLNSYKGRLSGVGNDYEQVSVAEEITRLEKCITIMKNQEDGTCIVPGLIPGKSALKPLVSKNKITILLVGETGCGKTAFMSLLLNLFQGYGPFELEDENNEDAESGLKKQESQTSDATLYTVTSPDGAEIRILDTPGLADTRGIDQDEQHKAKINKAIQEFVTTIDAVLIMANGTTERMPAATNYTLSTLTSLFPYSIIDNIGFIFTHCDSFTRNMDMKSLPDSLRKSKHWTLENPLAYHKKYRREVDAGSPESILKEGRDRLESIYQKTVCTLNEWLSWTDSRCPQPTHEINRLYQNIVDIEAQIEAAISLMTRIAERKRDIQQKQHDLDDSRKSKSAIQALLNQTTDYWEREPSDKHSTLCIAANCYSNCHVGCHVPYTLDPVRIGRYCAAFVYKYNDVERTRTESDSQAESRTCNHCPHQAKDHRHYRNIHVKKTKALHPTARDDLSRAESKQQQIEVAKRVVQEELNRIQLELDTAHATVNSLVDSYNSKSLNKNFAGHINSAIQMLDLRLEELKSKPGTETEQSVVRNAIQKLKSKLDILSRSHGSRRGH